MTALRQCFPDATGMLHQGNLSNTLALTRPAQCQYQSLCQQRMGEFSLFLFLNEEIRATLAAEWRRIIFLQG